MTLARFLVGDEIGVENPAGGVCPGVGSNWIVAGEDGTRGCLSAKAGRLLTVLKFGGPRTGC